MVQLKALSLVSKDVPALLLLYRTEIYPLQHPLDLEDLFGHILPQPPAVILVLVDLQLFLAHL